MQVMGAAQVEVFKTSPLHWAVGHAARNECIADLSGTSGAIRVWQHTISVQFLAGRGYNGMNCWHHIAFFSILPELAFLVEVQGVVTVAAAALAD